MKIGVVYPQTESGGDPAFVRRFGLAMEEMGLNHLLVYDHVAGAQHADRDPPLWGPYTDADTFHDPLMMCNYLAAITERIEFATGVLILPQRQTVLVAKQTTDLDRFSNERLRLGVGTGWNYVEYEALGVDWKTRGAKMDEQIDLLRKLWTTPLLTYEGRFHKLTRANINLRPRRQIPIWIGGFSEPAYQRGAKFGDGYIFGGPFDDVVEGLASVKRHLAANGRALDGFGLDVIPTRTRTLAEVVELLKRWRDHGGTHGTIYSSQKGLAGKGPEAHIDFVAEVLARL